MEYLRAAGFLRPMPLASPSHAANSNAPEQNHSWSAP
jgi:hypothetical protein